MTFMKVSSVSTTNTRKQPLHFKGSIFPADIPYKKLLQQGLKDTYGISCKVEDLNSIAGPNELMFIIKNLKPEHYAVGEDFRANFHVHTRASDGHMTLEDYLEQCVDWANHIFKNPKHKDKLPPFSASITDHDTITNAKKAIAEISQDPERYKNFKFVSGCEFLFDGYKKPYSAFEAVGLGFNPFDEALEPMTHFRVSKNTVDDIQKVKDAGGVLSWAHPIVTTERITDEEFAAFLKEKGVDGIEGNYQYNRWDKDFVDTCKPYVDKLVEKFKFFVTGGTDTHGKTIFF